MSEPATTSRDAGEASKLSGVYPGAHSVVWVRGPDATSFLDGLVSQSVAATGAGEVRPSLLLSAQGKMRALLWLLGGAADQVGLITQHSTAEVVVADLTRFRFRVDAAIEPEGRPVVTLVGPAAAGVLAAHELAATGHDWRATPDGLVAPVPFTASGPERYVLVGDAAAAVAADAPSLDDPAYEGLRIAVGEPLGSVDFDDTTISHELGPVDTAVDFAKGCYLGQELVARIDSRGRVTKQLRRIRSEGKVALAGASLVADDREVGKVTSAATSPNGDATIGLALVRHEVEPGDEITAHLDGDEVQAQVEAIEAARHQ